MEKTFYDFFKDYYYDFWNYDFLLKNPHIKAHEIIEIATRSHLNYIPTSNPNLTIEFISKYPNLPWNFNGINGLATNPNLTKEDMYKILKGELNCRDIFNDETIDRVIDRMPLVANPSVDMEIMEAEEFKELLEQCSNNDLLFDPYLEQFSKNPNLTWEYISKNPQIKWNYGAISEHPCITFEIFRSNPQFKWKLFNFSRNPNITWKIIKSNPSIEWDVRGVSGNPNITLNHVLNNSNYFWNFHYLLANPNIIWEHIEILTDFADRLRLEEIEKNKLVPGSYKGYWSHLQKRPQINFWFKTVFSRNPNLTPTILYKYNHKKTIWNIIEICRNPMSQPFKNKNAKKIQKWYRKYKMNYFRKNAIIKAFIIKEWFDNPDNPVSKKLREKWFKLGILSEII